MTRLGAAPHGEWEGASNARRYERSVAASVRAAQGVFYTPDALADRVVWGALALWLARRGVLGFDEAWACFADGRDAPRSMRALALEALEGVSVLDPSCGAGALLAAAERALSPLGSVRYIGTDLDAAAIALARARLGARARLEVGDALDASGPRAELVLTNPPYGATGRERGDPDRYVSFWRAATLRVARGGVLAVLAPTSWRTGPRYARARREVVAAAGLDRVIELASGAFEDAYVETCIALCAPGSTSTSTSTSISISTPTLGDLFTSSRGILAPHSVPTGATLLLGPVAPFTWPSARHAFTHIAPSDVIEGRRALSPAARSGPRLLVRRIVGRTWRLTCIATAKPAIIKKDFYVLSPKDPALSLAAYAALLHARPVAERLAAADVAARKGDFAQLTLTMLRELPMPRLVRATPEARARVRALQEDAPATRDPALASAWLEARAREGAAIGSALLRAGTRHLDADAAWDVLRARLDAFAVLILRPSSVRRAR